MRISITVLINRSDSLYIRRCPTSSEQPHGRSHAGYHGPSWLKGSRELLRKKKVLVFWCRFLVRNRVRGETEADRGRVYASCWLLSRKGKERESKQKARAIFCQRAEAEIPKQPSAPQPGELLPASGSSCTCCHSISVRLMSHSIHLLCFDIYCKTSQDPVTLTKDCMIRRLLFSECPQTLRKQ